MSEPIREAAIDPATHAALRDVAGDDFVDELVETFFEEAPRMLADLRAAADDDDAGRFRRAAHSLKSNAMTFGALPLGAMAKALEVGGLDHATPALDAIDALDAEYARVADALRALRHG